MGLSGDNLAHTLPSRLCRSLKEEAESLVSEGSGYPLTILLGHALSAGDFVPSLLHRNLHVIDDSSRLFPGKEKTLALRK